MKLRKIRRMIVSDGSKHIKFGKYFGTFSLVKNVEKVSFQHKPLKHPIRLLHLSDFHASEAVPLDFISKAVNMGLECRPDVICITGDYVTTSHFNHRQYVDILSRLPAAAPTFSCFGNHDGCLRSKEKLAYQDTRQVGKLLADSGIRYLYNTGKVVKIKQQKLLVAGLADLWSKGMYAEYALPKKGKATDIPIILLAHNPDSKDRLADYEWDLMLSGHTHGGQFKIPFWGAPFAPVCDKRFTEGLRQWQGRWVHVTRGVGNVHGIRINCRPQVSLIELN